MHLSDTVTLADGRTSYWVSTCLQSMSGAAMTSTAQYWETRVFEDRVLPNGKRSTIESNVTATIATDPRVDPTTDECIARARVAHYATLATVALIANGEIKQ